MRDEAGIRFFLVDADADALLAAGRRDPRTTRAAVQRLRTGRPAAARGLPRQCHACDPQPRHADGRRWRSIWRRATGAGCWCCAASGRRTRLTAAAFERSAAKFGLKIAAVKDFLLSNDPRNRAQNNIALMTAEPDYDVLFLADGFGEFGRYVPYQTHLPRPVVGAQGLEAAAWHWAWERHGAPQLNQRFDRKAEREMKDADWAAWAAYKVIVEAVARTGGTDFDAVAAYLKGETLTFDAYKGNPASFRPWNNQLRQPILLHTHNAVTARAPLDGFLHRRDVLDTLGIDEPESKCRF